MSASGLEEKVENMNVDEKVAVDKKKGKDIQKTKKKDVHSSFPLEVIYFPLRKLRIRPVCLSLLMHREVVGGLIYSCCLLLCTFQMLLQHRERF